MWVLVCLGTLVFFPAIRAPMFLDDFLHRAMVEGSFPGQRGVFDLYDFVGDDNRTALLERGFLPWWAEPNLTIRFFRPLASALLYVEHRSFAAPALPMHLHSFAWWIAAVAGARALFRRALEPRAARIAAVVFALAPCHALPLGWVANRATLIALALGTFALLTYVRWREERRPERALLAASLFALALFGGGEYALAFGGYVLAIETTRRAEAWSRRLTGIAPLVVPTLAYLAVRGALGYGSRGSGFYSDPIHDLGSFGALAPVRAASLFGSAWLTLDVGWWRYGTIAPWVLGAVVTASAVAGFLLVRHKLESLEPRRRASTTWLGLGSLLAVLPTLAVTPSVRVLGVAMLGVAAVVGTFLDHEWFPRRDASGPTRGIYHLAPLVGVTLAFAHLVHGPGSAWLGGTRHRASALDFVSRVEIARAKIDSEHGDGIGMIRGFAGAFFMPFALRPSGDVPPSWFVLSQAGHVLALRRDQTTIDLVAPVDGTLYPVGERNLYRAATGAFKKGDVIRVPGMTVSILSTSTDGARSARFVFDRDPETLTWMADDYEELRAARLPAVGFGDVFDPRPKPEPTKKVD